MVASSVIRSDGYVWQLTRARASHADQCTSIGCTDGAFLTDNLEVYL